MTTWKYWKLWVLPPPIRVGQSQRAATLGVNRYTVTRWDGESDVTKVTTDPEPDAPTHQRLAPPPIRVGYLYRQSSAGEFQTWRDGQWVTIEARRMYDETMADEIDEDEANKLALDL